MMWFSPYLEGVWGDGYFVYPVEEGFAALAGLYESREKAIEDLPRVAPSYTETAKVIQLPNTSDLCRTIAVYPMRAPQ